MRVERFEFGKNWESFSQRIDEESIRRSENRLAALLGTRDLRGNSFLDIGCGSGLHALAALRFGAAQVAAIDLDPHSVATAQAVLTRFWDRPNYVVRRLSVFDLETVPWGDFDIVYSWGVLHHTGNLRRALRMAARRVTAGGLFAVALYGKTRFCAVWTRIKRWYVNAPPAARARAERWYVRLFGFYLLLRLKRLRTHIADYGKNKRGMDFYHDVRDWIGGYPYESIAPAELIRFAARENLTLLKQNVRRRSGLFGSGNDEYLFRRL